MDGFIRMTQAIESVALKCISECGNIDPMAHSMLMNILCARLRGALSAEAATQQCYALIRDSQPADKVNAIMETPNHPISYRSIDEVLAPNKSRSRARNWNQYEDQRLLAGVWKYGLSNWALVARFVGNGRTHSQCSQRWNRGLDPSLSKAPWSPEEEKRLVELVGEYGEKSWKRVAMRLGNRSDVQCRYHFQQLQKHSEQEKLMASDTEKKEGSDPVNPVIDMRTTIDQIFNVQIEKGLWDPWCDGEFAGLGTESLLF